MKPQSSIGSYRINLYFPKLKLAIECNEHDHKDRDINHELMLLPKDSQKYDY